MTTVQIPLANNKGFALIDEEDYPLVSQYKWSLNIGTRTNYARTSMKRANGKRTIMGLHQLLLNPPSGFMPDHINGNGLDNRRENLRICTKRQNNYNRVHRQAGTTSQYLGVYLFAKDKTPKWRAKIQCDHRPFHLGSFIQEEDAAHAYDAKASELFGEFARLNFPRTGDDGAI